MLKPDRIVSTTCPYCGVGCNLQLHIQGDTIFKVTTPFDAPVNKGNLCVKGRFGYDFVYHLSRPTRWHGTACRAHAREQSPYFAGPGCPTSLTPVIDRWQ